MKLTHSSLLAALLVIAGGCASSGQTVEKPSGLVYTVVRKGSGPSAKPGQHVLIHESTTLRDGTLIYSTHTKGQPLKFLLGGSQVIDGVDEGVTCMQVGERRTMVVPPSLSRRSSYPDSLSPDDTLYYDVKLVAIKQP